MFRAVSVWKESSFSFPVHRMLAFHFNVRAARGPTLSKQRTNDRQRPLLLPEPRSRINHFTGRLQHLPNMRNRLPDNLQMLASTRHPHTDFTPRRFDRVAVFTHDLFRGVLLGFRIVQFALRTPDFDEVQAAFFEYFCDDFECV